MTRKAIVLNALLLLALTGCMPMTFSWYQPSGSGVATQSGCGMPADVMQFDLDEKGSRLEVRIKHPRGRDTDFVSPRNERARLSYYIYLAPGSRVKIVDPTFVFLGNSGNKLYEYKPKLIHGTHVKPEILKDGSMEYLASQEDSIQSISEELISSSNDPIPKDTDVTYRDYYYLFLNIGFLPQEFQANYPPLMINGNRTVSFPVKYIEREGTFFVCRRLL